MLSSARSSGRRDIASFTASSSGSVGTARSDRLPGTSGWFQAAAVRLASINRFRRFSASVSDCWPFATVCSKRDTYPDGTEFVGVGVAPDREVAMTVADLRAGRDPVLEAALETVRAAAR